MSLITADVHEPPPGLRPAKSYTVSNLTALSRSYIEEARQVWAEGDVVETELQLSLFLAWLQKREPNGDDRRA